MAPSLSLMLTLSAAGATSIVKTKSCDWHVVDQKLRVETPALYTAQVEQTCPVRDMGMLHKESCTECEGFHNPCAGEFMACVGCCMSPAPRRIHSCKNIKAYFFDKNAKDLDCDARIELDDGEVELELGDETQNRETSGTLTSTCETEIQKGTAAGIPAKLKFDCSGCITQGVPDLLKQCCDKGMEWQNSRSVQKMNAAGFTAFVWLDGCHYTKIGDGSISFSPQKYAKYTEAQIDAKMNEFIDDQYCAGSVKPSDDKCPSRRLQNSSKPRRLSVFEECAYGNDDSPDQGSDLDGAMALSPLMAASTVSFISLLGVHH